MILTVFATRQISRHETKRSARSLLLQRIQEAAEKHYLTLQATAHRTAAHLKKLKGKARDQMSDDDLDQLTFNMLRYFRNALLLTKSRGGYVLSDKDGEKVVVAAADVFTRAINTVVKMQTRTRAALKVGPHATFPEFKDDAANDVNVRKVREALADQLPTRDLLFATAAAALEVYKAVLDYEFNVAYFPFYDNWPSPPSVSVGDLDALRRNLVDGAEALAVEFDDFLQKQPRRRQYSDM